MKNVLIFGATSAIAQETAKQFAVSGYNLALAARSHTKTLAVIEDIRTNYPLANAKFYQFDALEYDKHSEIIQNVVNDFGNIDIVMIAHGTLTDNVDTRQNFELFHKSFENNAISVFSISELVAEYFKDQKKGSLVVISSVAGDRGRQSNYVYGAAKGAVSIYLQGLRNRLSKSNVNVITVKPGFVDTPMTAHLPKNFLFAKPADIAKGIIDAIDNQKNVVYLPFFWKFIMLIIKLIPESIFKRLSL
ncbi:MAG: SDR family oxidoreductase [Candidatus Kapabacteria bacterium]|nr:SDR family oxidoreductase [Ignavibacteriota bacterium]MCW5885043.1 SDR family oxidoreductase [Candidatus Kapabacteria bacterium]